MRYEGFSIVSTQVHEPHPNLEPVFFDALASQGAALEVAIAML
jgi:hypothetical protein